MSKSFQPVLDSTEDLLKDPLFRVALIDHGWKPPSKSIDMPQCPTVAYQHPVSPDCISTDRWCYKNPKELLLKDDVFDHIEWLEKGIDEWRALAINLKDRLDRIHKEESACKRT